eukprot:jgi/Ulvmu1/10513/UM064_0051.1
MSNDPRSQLSIRGRRHASIGLAGWRHAPRAPAQFAAHLKPGRCPRFNQNARIVCRAEPAFTADTVVSVESVSKSHDGLRILFDQLTFTLKRGERLALIGANGSGKTSLLRLIAGQDWPDDGEIIVRNDAQISYLPQNVDIAPEMTAIDAIVQSDSPVAAIVREYTKLLEQGEDADRAELNAAMNKMTALDAWELEANAKSVLAQVGIHNPGMKLEAMSGGQARKVAVAAALLGSPDVLILDEPTNHMDVQFIEWMVHTIKTSGVTLLLVTHDRAFLEDTCTSILELDEGRGFVHNVGGRGGYERYRQRRAERRKAQAKLAQDARVMLRKETEWMRRQPKARSTKSKARVDAYEELTTQAKSGPRMEAQIDFGDVAMARQGQKVIVMKDCSKCWEGKPIIDSFTYEFAQGERIGIAGPNGAGKSTLMNIIAGVDEVDDGLVVHGDTTVVGYFAQHPPPVNPRLKLIDYVGSVAEQSITSDSVGIDLKPDKLLSKLGFDYPRQQQYVSSLSGGERRRLHLAAVLQRKPNFLILDEPTNDLDLQTIENLEQILDPYLGCVLVVSHDKAFMTNVVGSMFVLEGDGLVRKFNGKYEEYLEYIEERGVIKAQQAAEAIASASALEGNEASKRKTAFSSNGSGNHVAEEKPVKRLGYREKQELEQLDGKVEAATASKANIEARIADCAKAGDFEQVAKLTEELATVSQSIDTMTDRWMELAERAEIAGTV